MSHWHSLLFKVIKDGTKLYFKTYMFYMFALHVFPCGPSVLPYCNLCTCLTQKWVYFLASIDFHEYYWVILLIYDFTLLFRLSTCWAAFFLICWSFFLRQLDVINVGREWSGVNCQGWKQTQVGGYTLCTQSMWSVAVIGTFWPLGTNNIRHLLKNKKL